MASSPSTTASASGTSEATSEGRARTTRDRALTRVVASRARWLTTAAIVGALSAAALPAVHAQHVHVPGMDMTGIEFGQPPPAESAAQLRLDTSLRLGEFLDIPLPDGRLMPAWVVYPLRSGKAPAVIVIHEADGLTDWVRAVADQAAGEGYLAIAPDLLSGQRASADGSVAVSERSFSRDVATRMATADVKARIDATRNFVVTLPNANGKFGLLGFAWGGGVAFRYVAAEPSSGAAVVYYGELPPAAELGTLASPVLGIYPRTDDRLVRMATATAREMKRLKKDFQVRTYREAAGNFLRVQDGGVNGANETASIEAWVATFSFFRRHLGR